MSRIPIEFKPYKESEPEWPERDGFIRYTAGVLLPPVIGVALHAPLGCAGLELWHNSACLPPGQHPAHIEQHAPLLSTNVFDLSSGSSLSSSAAAAPVSLMR